MRALGPGTPGAGSAGPGRAQDGACEFALGVRGRRRIDIDGLIYIPFDEHTMKSRSSCTRSSRQLATSQNWRRCSTNSPAANTARHPQLAKRPLSRAAKRPPLFFSKNKSSILPSSAGLVSGDLATGISLVHPSSSAYTSRLFSCAVKRPSLVVEQLLGGMPDSEGPQIGFGALCVSEEQIVSASPIFVSPDVPRIE